ncbi:hypothetical protein P3W85_41865 [Cupriavidus basilensis]|uniref:DUF1449 family protein n=1 Tax=Cupriavidus basilensis TaxID=68895 RepID=A0ABT6B403_9BURK|nr:hypothetical protein [Cupriavidus basilensis]MDF3839439.1 hypothetical protein [Cupriavidus basilensis]
MAVRPSPATDSKESKATSPSVEPLNWKMLYRIPVVLLVVLALVGPGLIVGYLPMIASETLGAQLDRPMRYAPYSTWLWRGLLLLCMTHVAYAVYRLASWLGRKTSPALFPVEILVPISLFACCVGFLSDQHVILNAINVHAGFRIEKSATLLESSVSCTTTSGRSGRRSTTCDRRTRIIGPEGKLYVRGPTDDRVIEASRPGDRLQLTICQSIFGTSLMAVDRIDPWGRKPSSLDRSVEADSASPAALTCKQRKPPPSPSVMDALSVSPHNATP